jgi:hypothetical protein
LVQRLFRQFGRTAAAQSSFDFNIKTEKPADQIKVLVDKDTATLDIFSQNRR